MGKFRFLAIKTACLFTAVVICAGAALAENAAYDPQVGEDGKLRVLIVADSSEEVATYTEVAERLGYEAHQQTTISGCKSFHSVILDSYDAAKNSGAELEEYVRAGGGLYMGSGVPYFIGGSPSLDVPQWIGGGRYGNAWQPLKITCIVDQPFGLPISSGTVVGISGVYNHGGWAAMFSVGAGTNLLRYDNGYSASYRINTDKGRVFWCGAYLKSVDGEEQTDVDGNLSKIVDAAFIWVTGAIPLDLDIDSDNNSSRRADNTENDPAADDDEDEIEEDLPGKIVQANQNDFDNDGIPDYADGFNLLPANADDNIVQSQEGKKAAFAPILLKIPACTDFEKAKVRFTYSASDPSSIIPPATENDEYSLPAGHLRIWALDGWTERDKRGLANDGDFIKSLEELTIEQLGSPTSDDDHIWRFYVEGIAVMANASEHEVKVELDLEGKGEWVSEDIVFVSVASLEIVTPAGNYNNGENPDAPRVKTSVVGVSNPKPPVELKNLSVSMDGNIVKVKFDGIVKDKILDNLPVNLHDDYLGPLSVEVNGSPVQQGGSIPLTVGVDTPGGFWRQHPYKGTFDNHTVTLDAEELGEGTHIVQVTTGKNPAGNDGFDQVAVTLEKREILLPGGGDEGTGPEGLAATNVNLYFAAPLMPEVADEVTYFRGVREPQEGDWVLRQQIPASPEAPLPGASKKEVKIYDKAYKKWLKEVKKLDKAPVYKGTINSLATIISLKKAPKFNNNRQELIEATIQYQTGTRTLSQIVVLSETGVDTNLFRAAIGEEAIANILTLNMYLPINTTSTVSDSLQYWYRPREPLPDDVKLSETEGNESSLVFKNEFSGADAQFAITQHNGQASQNGQITLDQNQPDVLKANVTYTFADGAVMSFANLELVETAADSRVFRTGVGVEVVSATKDSDSAAFIAPPRIVQWVADVQERRGSQAGYYMPIIARIKGLSEAPESHKVSVAGVDYELTKLVPDDGYWYLRGGSSAILTPTVKDGTINITGPEGTDPAPRIEAEFIIEQNGKRLKVGETHIASLSMKIEFTSDWEDDNGKNLLKRSVEGAENGHHGFGTYEYVGKAYQNPEWVQGSRNFPVCHARGARLGLKVTIREHSTPRIDFWCAVESTSTQDFLKFEKTSYKYKGYGVDSVDFNVTSVGSLPDAVSLLKKSIQWNIHFRGGMFTWASTRNWLMKSGPHELLLTYDRPKETCSLNKDRTFRREWIYIDNNRKPHEFKGKEIRLYKKRNALTYARAVLLCQPYNASDSLGIAGGLAQKNKIATKVSTFISSFMHSRKRARKNTAIESGGEDGIWAMLDLKTDGQCAPQAHLMEMCMRLLGIDATSGLLYASYKLPISHTDALMEPSHPNPVQSKLFRDIDPEIYLGYLHFVDSKRRLNKFQAYCETNGKYYPLFVNPANHDKWIGDSLQDFLHRLVSGDYPMLEQRYFYLSGPNPNGPTDGDWTRTRITVEESP